ncbi:MAG: hypothetical protein JNJ58_06440 [Chitinophagaceae bacterium]|nr:hypothetical protein [Chitinophagaceae bacterium]
MISLCWSSCQYANIQSITNTCDTSSVQFNKTIQPMMNNHCNSCHGGVSPSGGISLEGYNHVFTYGPAALHAMETGSMPQGAPKIDACSIALFKSWLDAGAPNN